MSDEFEKFRQDSRLLYTDLWTLLVTKQADYGAHAITGSPGGAVNGLRVRIHDKTSRLNHLLDSGSTPNHESIRDTLRDLVGYYVIWLMVEDGTWPGTEK